MALLTSRSQLGGSVGDVLVAEREKIVRVFADGVYGWDHADLFEFELSGQFLLDPNEVNGWGAIGVHDNTNSQDLGNVGDTNISRISGGLSWSHDVRVLKMFAKHYNSNAAAQAWGWVLFRQEWDGGTNVVTNEYILDEVADNGGVGPRDYLNTVTQKTDLDLSDVANNVIPAGDMLGLGVASPTAVTTNYYSRIMSGHLLLERL